MDVKAEGRHYGHEHRREHKVGREAVAHGAPDKRPLAAAEMAAHDGREAIGEARGENDNEREHGIDEAGGRQLLHGMVAYHYRVGKTEHHVAYLTYHNRYAQTHQGAVTRRNLFRS